MAIIVSPPLQDSLIELDESPTRRHPFYLAKGWIIWLQNSLIPRVQASAQLLATKSLTGQSASIGATAIPLPSLSGGLYRLSWYARVTTPGGVSSSLTVMLGWTEGGVALSLSGAAITGNLVTSVQSGVIPVRLDSQSAVTYATTYASAGTPMQYRLDLSVEAVD